MMFKGNFHSISLMSFTSKIKLTEAYFKLNSMDKAASNNLNSSIEYSALKSLCSTNFTTSMICQTEEENAEPGFGIKEITDLKSEIEFIELYNLTLKNYSKDIYDPCRFFFVNKFQSEKLYDDLKKLLVKVCDFNENISSYNINKINTFEGKKMLKEIQDCCSQSNFKKLHCIFSHFKINANFFYSDATDALTQNTTMLDLTNAISGNVLSQTMSNFTNQLHLSVPGNQRSSANTNFIRNLTGGNRVNMNSNNNGNGNNGNKERLVNLFSYLKLFKDKPEQVKFVKFLIDEFGYIPLKLESDSLLEVKLIKDIEWKLPLNII